MSRDVTPILKIVQGIIETRPSFVTCWCYLVVSIVSGAYRVILRYSILSSRTNVHQTITFGDTIAIRNVAFTFHRTYSRRVFFRCHVQVERRKKKQKLK